ncbi:MAG: DUF456 domain-containing protein [Caldilineales bacterium]|nr:DUF456 domain-containing protein [Caldilineales bacterium]
MNPDLSAALQFIAYIGLGLGLLGTILPLIPGTILIWLSALLWAWADGFEQIGWPTLLVMGLLVIAVELADVALASLGARQGGASWRGLIIAGVAALIGFLVFNLIGALIGAAAGMLAWETYHRQGDWRAAWRASRGVLIGYLLAMVTKFSVGVILVVIFIWQAFYA